MTMEFAIDVKGLTHRYGSAKVLDDAELALEPGELYGLLGRNGAGKSTAIRAMCGFLRPDRGVIRVAGRDVVNDPLSVRRHIGVVSEDVEVYEKLTAREFLAFAAKMHGLSAAEARSRCQDLLRLLELDFACDRAIASYSLGMKKKTAFAAALIHAPRVLFLDEPFNGIDAASTRSLCNLLRTLTAQEGVTVVFTSHVTEMIERICTRIGFLHEGKIVPECDLRNLFADKLSERSTLDDLLIAVSEHGRSGVPSTNTVPGWYQVNRNVNISGLR